MLRPYIVSKPGYFPNDTTSQRKRSHPYKIGYARAHTEPIVYLWSGHGTRV